MTYRSGWAAVCCVIAVPLLLWAVVAPNPPTGPHPFMSDQSKCDTCHHVEWNAGVGTLDEDKFDRSFIDVCNNCHQGKMGRSHPVGVNPYKMVPRNNYPGTLPLQWSDDLMADVMTCVTCHDMHAARFSEEKLYSRQKEYPDSDDVYLTYYLRIRGSTPREGFAPLCKACHPKL